jgi:hypothetical protein
MRWDADELPAEALAERLARLRAAMARERLDAFLVYTNLVRPSAVCWLTGFTPYWSEGALLLLPEGAPVFATALSKRVAGWIGSTNPVSEIISAPRPGKALGARLATAGAKRVGVLELDALPTILYDDISAAAPETSLLDASAAFSGARRVTDVTERALLARADTIAREALSLVDASAADAGAVAGEVEKQARLAGAEEAYIAVVPNLAADRRLLRVNRPMPLGARFAVRASIAYKGCWVRLTHTFGREKTLSLAQAEKWFDVLRQAIEPRRSLPQALTAAVRALPGSELRGWMAESCIGSYPLQAVPASAAQSAYRPVPGEFLVLTIELALDGAPWLGADSFVVS